MLHIKTENMRIAEMLIIAFLVFRTHFQSIDNMNNGVFNIDAVLQRCDIIRIKLPASSLFTERQRED